MPKSISPASAIFGFTLCCIALMLAVALSGCSVARKLQKHSERSSIQSEANTAAKVEAKTKTATAVDSTGETRSATRTAEAASNETVEETTTTLYDAASGRIASVTHSRRRATGTATKTAQGSTAATATVSRQAKTEAATKSETKTEEKSSAKTKTLDKHSDTKVKTPFGTYALLAGGVLLVGSLAWKFVPVLAAYGSGGPIGLLFGFIRRQGDKKAV